MTRVDGVDAACAAGRAEVDDDGARPSGGPGGTPGRTTQGLPRGSTHHMTQSTEPEAPAEAASEAPTGSPAQPSPTLPDGFGDLDRRAIDTARVLAMDAVQKVGNGHPGTAMSMAPTAYLLFHKWLRHDPSDPNWTARDRFVLSMGHSSLTLYVQLYLSGYGLELADLQALRTWGSKTPGHPEVNHTPGVETTTGPLGQGVGNAVGMAMAARRERGLLDPEAPAGESLFDHTIWAFASDGDLEEGVSGEASSLAGTQKLGNLVLVYDDNRISIEDDTTVAFTDYMRGAVRLAALMQLPVTYVWTHDSIGLGEDGPTHQPIEHLAALRAMPGLDVVRPADANEVAVAWRTILEHNDRPAGLLLSRQNLPVFDRGDSGSAEGVARGADVLAQASGGTPEVILMGTGSEVQIAVAARERLEADGVPTRVVS